MSAPLVRRVLFEAVSSIFRTASDRKLADKTADQTAGSPVQANVECWEPDSRAPARVPAAIAMVRAKILRRAIEGLHRQMGGSV
jgi:hypothetical protein